jgi:hypothetical protein
MEATMKACGVSVLSLVDINNPIMASLQSTTKITPNNGDIVSWATMKRTTNKEERDYF